MPGSEWSENEVAELKKVFYAQAFETVEDLQDALLRLKADPCDDEVMKTVKRHVHTLKGDANSIGLDTVGTLCHRLEDLLARILQAGEQECREGLEILASGVDAVHSMLVASEAGKETDSADILFRIDAFLGNGPARESGVDHQRHLNEYEELQIQDALKNGLHVYKVEADFHPQCSERGVAALMLVTRLQTKGVVIATVPDPDSVDRSTARMTLWISTKLGEAAVRDEAIVAGMTECISVSERRDAAEQAAARQEDGPIPSQARVSGSEMLRVESSKVDRLMELVGELIIGRSMIDQIARDAGPDINHSDFGSRLTAANGYMDRAVADLQKGILKMRMVPVHSVFRKFPRMVRDLSDRKGKKTRVELIGSETELDKRIVDALGEPLAHLLRNALDHGIEPPDERRRLGKSEEAVITLRAYHEASQIVIEAADDGRGIDRGALKRKAVEQGILGEEEASRLSDAEALDLIFRSGLSTATAVSETSGRGVGMEAVKIVTDSLKGAIETESAPGRGTLFRLRLPLTLAVINVLLFEVGRRLYAAPLPVIAEVAKVTDDDIVTVEGRRTLLLRNRIISVVALEELFGLPSGGGKRKHVLVLALGARSVGLLIDRLLWQQELVIKAIDDRHLQTDCIAGGSILGSGKVVLILDVHAVVRKATAAEKKKAAPVQ